MYCVLCLFLYPYICILIGIKICIYCFIMLGYICIFTLECVKEKNLLSLNIHLKPLNTLTSLLSFSENNGLFTIITLYFLCSYATSFNNSQSVINK